MICRRIRTGQLLHGPLDSYHVHRSTGDVMKGLHWLEDIISFIELAHLQSHLLPPPLIAGHYYDRFAYAERIT